MRFNLTSEFDAVIKAEDTSAARLQAGPAGVKAFVEAKFGMSVHWGLYALEGRGEWVYYSEQIPFEMYRQRMARFNPQRFDAEEWADLMLESGQKLLLITSKHHDGFCLWDSPLTDFKVTNTPFRRDILAELAAALRARGIGLHFYYSLIDWTDPTYRTDWPAYVAYYQAQVRDLCTNYGPIGGILFDGYWPRAEFDDVQEQLYLAPRGAWDLAGTYDVIHALQPEAMIVNNTHVLPRPGEDYQIWELDMPGANTIGFNTTDKGNTPKAVWWNLNHKWVYWPNMHDVKSADEILSVEQQIRQAGGDVLLLNVGPRPWGDMHPDEQRVLREIGAKRRAYGL